MAVIASTAQIAWQISHARTVVNNRAIVVAHAVGTNGFALHHWLHEQQAMVDFEPVEEGEVRVLTQQELTSLHDHAASDILGADNPGIGFSIQYLIGRPEGEKRSYGIVVLEQDGASDRLREAIRHQVARNDDNRGSHFDAAHLASVVDGSTFDAATDIAVFASAFGAISNELILRQARSGWPALATETGLDMGNNKIINVAQVGTLELAANKVVEKSLNNLPEEDVVFTSAVGLVGHLPEPELPVLSAGGLTISGPVDIAGILNLPGTSSSLVGDDLVVEGVLNVTGDMTAGSIFSQSVQGDRLQSTGRLGVRLMRATRLTVNQGCTGC